MTDDMVHGDDVVHGYNRHDDILRFLRVVELWGLSGQQATLGQLWSDPGNQVE